MRYLEQALVAVRSVRRNEALDLFPPSVHRRR
jgi:hypothetical protein